MIPTTIAIAEAIITIIQSVTNTSIIIGLIFL
jgi:hypothetical protein